MKKVILLAIIMILAFAGISWAVLPDTGLRITYSGYVDNSPQNGTVNADTLITVFNPYNGIVSGVGIAVFDKYGNKIADSLLLNGGTPISSLPAKGWGWQTIGNLIGIHRVPGWQSPGIKYTFVVYWTKPAYSTPNRQLVIEIKEIIYTTSVYPTEGPWMPGVIKTWSEAAIGKTVPTQ